MNERKPSNMTPEQFGAWRQRHELTQAQAAERLGVSKRSIFGWEKSGPIPKSIELACRQLDSEKDGLDAARLIREQYPNIRDTYIVFPFQIRKSSNYAGVIEIKLEQEVLEWLEIHAPTASFDLKTVITESHQRLQVPIIIFEEDSEAFYFKMRWC